MAATFPGGVKVYSTKNPGDPIASATTNSLQEEVTAIEDFLITKTAITTIFKMIYPVGSIYMSVNSTNPGTLFGGTWVAWGTGRVPVGIDTSDADFNTVEETGGAKTHSHGLSAGFAKLALSTDNWLAIARKSVTTWTKTHKMTGTVTDETTTSAVGTELGGDTDSSSSLQPYIVCYMWKRTA